MILFCHQVEKTMCIRNFVSSLTVYLNVSPISVNKMMKEMILNTSKGGGVLYL